LIVAGTRVTVEHILEELGAGRSFEDLLASHPHLTRQSILAALAHAARILRNGEARPPGMTRGRELGRRREH
jgi:uncharacterized protein (DUF433 family)